MGMSSRIRSKNKVSRLHRVSVVVIFCICTGSDLAVPVVRTRTMYCKDSEHSQGVENQGDRYRGCGRNTALQSALAAVQAQGALTGQQAEEFARLFRLQNDRLIADFRNQAESRDLLSPRLSEALKRPTLKEFKAHNSTKNVL
jgi:hypothetical protein